MLIREFELHLVSEDFDTDSNGNSTLTALYDRVEVDIFLILS